MNKKLTIKSTLTSKTTSPLFNAARDLIVIYKMKNIEEVTNELHQDFQTKS